MKSKIQRRKREAWEIRFQKIEEAIAKLAEENKKTAEENRLAIERLSEENRLAIAKLSEENKRTAEENRLAISKLSEENRKTSEELRLFKESIKGITDGWGRFIEGMVEPSVMKFLKEHDFRILEIYQRAKFSKNGKNKEYDLIVVCDKDSVFMVSAKTHVSSKDVKELLVDMKEFSFFGERYRGRNLYGIIAGISYGRGADTFALRSGLYVVKVSGEVMQVQAPKKARVLRI
ncbi:MAG: hypothetical protein RMJ45_08885 [Candidatus Calescibacterium sp.]|nr:hypothetical protein [Candidatus Calescibacterium sp.]